MTQHIRFGWTGVSLLLVFMIVIVCAATTGAAAQDGTPIEISGNFSGDLVGYGEEAREGPDRGNQVNIEGQMTFEGENAVNPAISVESAQWTVLDASSVQVFVEGDRSVEFVTIPQEDAVVLNTEEGMIPSGTTLRVEFSAYLTGGTADNEVNAATVDVEYETPGGTPGDDSFEVPVDTSNSAINIIQTATGAEGDGGGSLLETIGVFVGIPAIGILLIVLAYLRLKTPEEPV